MDTMVGMRGGRRGVVPLMIVVGVMVGLWMAPVARAGDDEGRPTLTIADASQGCPPIAGSFVALLDPARGMLLLSGAPFPGGHRVGEVDGRPLHAAADGRSWSVAAVGMDGGSGAVWGDVVPFRNHRVSGCVAFDRDRFSSEGDLASYLMWLVDHVYAELPEEVRVRYPAFRLANREVRLRVSPDGHPPLTLTGREGSSLAFRVPGDDRTFVLLPFIVGDAATRVVVRVSSTEGEYFSAADKVAVGTVVVTGEEPAMLGDPPFEIRLLGAG